MIIPRIHARRMARGGISIPTTANFGFAALYNNSTGRDVLAVYYADQGAFGTQLVFQVLQGQQGTPGGTVSAMMTGDRAPAGLLSAGSVASIPTGFDMASGSAGEGSYGWNALYPLVLLSPGWSLQVTFATSTLGAAAQFGFVWQPLTPEELGLMEFEQP